MVVMTSIAVPGDPPGRSLNNKVESLSDTRLTVGVLKKLTTSPSPGHKVPKYLV